MEKAMTLREVTDYLDRLRVQFMATIRLDCEFATTRSSKCSTPWQQNFRIDIFFLLSL